MVVFYDCPGPWSVLGNLFFLLSALFGDVLFIRFWLVLGFTCLCTWAATGMTMLKDGWTNFGYVSLWNISMWCLPLILHFIALIKLLYAERHIHFKSGDEEALWRAFYRRSGMHRLEFQQSLKLGQWCRFKAGELILDTKTDSDKTQLFVVVDGRVRCTRWLKGLKASVFRSYSGELFDLKAGNVFGVRIGYFSDRFLAEAETDVLCFKWGSEGLYKLASSPQPALTSYWQKFVLYSVASEVNRKFASIQMDRSGAVDSFGIEEDKGYFDGDRSRDFSAFRPGEGPKRRSFLKFFCSSLAFNEPLGIRHTAPPSTGILAREAALVDTPAASRFASPAGSSPGSPSSGSDCTSAKTASLTPGISSFLYASLGTAGLGRPGVLLEDQAIVGPEQGEVLEAENIIEDPDMSNSSSAARQRLQEEEMYESLETARSSR